MSGDITSEYGIITSLNRQTGWGRVKLASRSLKFCVTEWDSGRPKRAPDRNETVKVLFNHEGELLAVRALLR